MRILVPLDGSELDQAIISLLTGAMAGLRPEVFLLGLIDEPSGRRLNEAQRPVPRGTMLGVVYEPPSPIAERKDQAVQECLAEMECYLRDMAVHFSVDVDAHVEAHVGNPPERVILDRAQSLHPDAIVMTTQRDRTGAQALSDAAAHVLRAGTAPLVLLPSRTPDRPTLQPTLLRPDP